MHNTYTSLSFRPLYDSLSPNKGGQSIYHFLSREEGIIYFKYIEIYCVQRDFIVQTRVLEHLSSDSGLYNHLKIDLET